MAIRLPLFEGDRNTSSISSGANTLAIQVTHNSGADFVIEGFNLVFSGTNTAIEEVLIRMYDAQRNRDIVTPNTELGTIGVRRGIAILEPFIRLKDPIVLRSGQSIQLYVNNTTANSIAAKDLGLTLFGYQVL
jgi:hypothetical protein